MNLIDHVEDSIRMALESRSHLTPKAIDVRGFATPFQRHLTNNLCCLPVSTYLEMGLYCGATICSAMFDNPHLRAIGIDNCSQFAEAEDIRTIRDNNLKAYEKECDELLFFHEDCLNLPDFVKDRIYLVDFLYYDADHAEEPTSKVLEYFLDQMSDQFILMFDDTNWNFVATGIEKGFEKLEGRIKIEKEWNLTGEIKENDLVYHNGIGLYVISKK